MFASMAILGIPDSLERTIGLLKTFQFLMPLQGVRRSLARPDSAGLGSMVEVLVVNIVSLLSAIAQGL